MNSKFYYENKENIKKVKYENIYFFNNEFYFLTLDKNIQLQEVKILGGPEHSDCIHKNEYVFKPNIKFFNNEKEINNFLDKEIIEIKGISNYFSHYYEHNIGHGLFDALYPSFLTLLNFFNENNNYTNLINLLHVPGWVCPMKCTKDWVLEIMEKFSGNKNLLKNNLDKNKIYKFEVLIAGSGYAGISSINKNGIMPGKKLNVLSKFRDRFYKNYNINVENTKTLSISIIDSDRYSENDKTLLLKICEELNKNHNCNYLNWKDIDDFKKQLNILSKIDIYICSPGTSGNYFPFLREKSIFINLGTNISGAYNINQLMEVNMALLSNDLLIDYYNIFQENEYNYDKILKLIDKNINLHQKITNNKDIIYEPIIPNYIKIWQELFMEKDNDLKDKNNLDELVLRMNNDLQPNLVPYRYPEILIQNYKISTVTKDFLNEKNKLYLEKIKKKYINILY